ncbi:MAG: gamma-glutamyl-gamma-aminobutyrate hydrolase family protein [Blastocatellia bacterium]|nr:gamma-glutamyl-gamma-aminobutyrate hydrolase family protein [Blastocatellia bacterium]
MASVTHYPVIGITTRLDAENNIYLKRYYAEAIEAAGGMPVHIPLIPDRNYLCSLAGKLEGLLLSGSNSDLDPVYYDEEPHPRLGTVTPERDKTDMILLEIAEEKKLPVLGICFGLQSLNVSRGGTLFQDLESQYNDPIKHQQGQTVDRPSHHITLEGNSLLARLAGSDVARVNSSHHQAIKGVGRDLRVIARAHDGVIEAVFDTRPEHFTLGVQWHPEVGWERDDFSQAIFRSFIEATKTMQYGERKRPEP